MHTTQMGSSTADGVDMDRPNKQDGRYNNKHVIEKISMVFSCFFAHFLITHHKKN